MGARARPLAALLAIGTVYGVSQKLPSPYTTVAAVRDPLSMLKASQFLSEEMGSETPLKTGAANTVLFLASLALPGSLPNPFAITRWDSCVYAAYTDRRQVIGVVQTALANIEPVSGQLQTVRFFQNVVVANAWRRQGVASSLLDFADAADGRYEDALAVEPHNQAAVQLYERRGFQMLLDEPEREGMRLMLRQVGDRHPI